ncbi:carnosine N-methyltransferase 2-like [Patiria miniata]|uniref:Uncharacterized protein n=1 Tax=Patiria miniata TaxID=46514 RepID=A0A913ZB07_PATMI|nr:carnosine N-methyltransferase 2-like [Patiria miniata]
MDRQTTGQLFAGAPTTRGLLRHMGVGSGSGELEIQIIRALLEKFKCIYNLVIEPSTYQIDLYKKLVRNNKELSAAVEFDWRQQTLEDYIASDDGRGRGEFDVITSVHTIYYGGPMEYNVPYLFDLLAEGGVLAIVLLSDTDSLSQVQRHFLSPSIAGYRYYTKQKLQSFLTTSNVSHQTIDVPRFNIDVTPCFDYSSKEGSLLVVGKATYSINKKYRQKI